MKPIETNKDYQEYVNEGGTLTLSDYRLNNTSILIKGVYDKIKSIHVNVAVIKNPVKIG